MLLLLPREIIGLDQIIKGENMVVVAVEIEADFPADEIIDQEIVAMAMEEIEIEIMIVAMAMIIMIMDIVQD
jgi:hypothetical protein